MRQVDLISAYMPFDFDAVAAAARARHEQALLAAQDQLSRRLVADAERVARTGSVTDIYRFYNSDDAIRRNDSAYMYIARVGDDADFTGARLVADWHLRNLEMFAKLTRLVRSRQERILVLYGQGHAFLLRQFISQSPDLRLVDPSPLLK